MHSPSEQPPRLLITLSTSTLSLSLSPNPRESRALSDPTCRTVPTSLVATASQAADDNTEEGNDSVDNGSADGPNASDYGHNDIADCLANALKL
jgi:hypothetical protein